MDLPAPSAPASAPATHLRVKWEHVMIALIIVTIIAFAITAWLAGGAEPTDAVTSTKPAPEAAAQPLDAAALTPTSTLSMDDAVGLVEEARGLMGEARWVEAADRLDSVPAEFRATSGADALAADLELQRTQHDNLRAELLATVEARQWRAAKALLKQLAAIAPLDAELLDAQAVVESALTPQPTTPKAVPTEAAPAAATPAAAAKPAASTTSAGTAAKPAAAAKPSAPAMPAASTKPATGGGAGSDITGAAPGAASDIAGAIALTPAQEAELKAALGALQ